MTPLEIIDAAITHIRDNIQAGIYPNDASILEAKDLLKKLNTLASEMSK